jgi:hypothetical protein
MGATVDRVWKSSTGSYAFYYGCLVFLKLGLGRSLIMRARVGLGLGLYTLGTFFLRAWMLL